MDRPVAARLCFLGTALAVMVGLVVQLRVSAGLSGTPFDSAASRVVNVFCYFTVQSNVLVGVTTGLLAVRLDRTSTLFRVCRLAGLIAIAITGVVYHLVLAGLQDLQGDAAVADALLHTVVPLLAVAGWLLYGPRRLTSWRVAGLAVAFPLAWVVLALVRGAAIDFYPYPFVDVGELGYARVLVNVAGVGALFFALAAVALSLDRRLDRRGDRRNPLPRQAI